MSEAQNLREAGDRIERLLDEVQASSDAPTWVRVETVVRLVTELYGAGIERLLDLVTEASEVTDPETLLERLIADELVASLLVLHGLHPHDLATRVQAALDDVRPYLGSHGGDVELLGVDEPSGVVRLKMLGSCDGCPSSSVTLKLAVEGAITAAAPEVTRIDVEGANGESPAPGEIPVQLTRKRGGPDGDDGWAPVHGLNRLGSGRLAPLEVAGEAVLCCRVGADLYAYRDRCAACGAALRGGSLDGAVLRCGSCGAAFDVRRAGRSLDGARDHLEPLPLLADGGEVKIAVPAGAGP